MDPDQHATNVSIDARLCGLEATCRSIRDLMNERDRRYEEQFIASREAVKLAHGNFLKWQESANEWRQAMTDKDRNFVTKGALWGYVVGALGIILSAMIILLQRFNH
jgi:hypothetical protein